MGLGVIFTFRKSPLGGSHRETEQSQSWRTSLPAKPCQSPRCRRGRLTLISPEVAEPVRRKLGVSDRVLDVLVAEIVLQGSGIVPVVGKLIAARMPQHVRMQRERHLGGLAEPLDEMVEADGANWSAALRDEDISLVRTFTAELAQGADFIASDRMDGWRAVLGPADVQGNDIFCHQRRFSLHSHADTQAAKDCNARMLR